jgi:hypothetical protein
MSNNTAWMIQVRDDLVAALDAKLKDMPEWRAFREVDRQIVAASSGAAQAAGPRPGRRPRTDSFGAPRKPYADLALDLINSSGAPQPTPEIVAYIMEQQPQPGRDVRKVRINIQSGLSRDPRLTSVAWGKGRAWWHSNRPVPAMGTKEAA